MINMLFYIAIYLEQQDTRSYGEPWLLTSYPDLEIKDLTLPKWDIMQKTT